MVFVSFQELFDVILMTLAVGYIFMDFFKVPRVLGFQWRALLLGALVTAPAVILHELAHKFVAIGFGAQATFHAAYIFLALGIFLKLVKSPIIFFVPGFVTIPVALPLMPLALVSFAGPGVNGLLYIISVYVMAKYSKKMSRRTNIVWLFTRRINGFLFILNMLPFPGFDGFKVYASLFGILF